MSISPQTPLVSVIIPTFNYARYLGEAIESALQQSYPAVEIIVMDDGSTDNTPDVAARYGNRIRYHRGQNKGVYAVRQASLAHVKGEYFLNLDADNRLHPEFIARTIEHLHQADDPNCAFVYTQRRYFGEREGISRFPAYSLNLLKQRNFIDMGSLLRAGVVRKFGFDPTFNSGCGDHDFFLTLAEHGLHGVLLNEPLVDYRIHPASITQSVNKTYRQVQITKRLIRKHHALFSANERKDALRTARDRVLLALVHNRKPDHPLSQRLMDLCAMRSASGGSAQFWEQLRYTITPHRFPRQ